LKTPKSKLEKKTHLFEIVLENALRTTGESEN